MDQPLAMARGGQDYFFHADHLGSIRKVTDAAGSVVNDYDYDSYGRFETRVHLVEQPYGFTGREFDADSGLYFYRARYYDPNSGRFLSEDPIGFESGTANLYSYVSNNPLNLTDPSGNCGIGGAILGGILGGLESAALSQLFNGCIDTDEVAFGIAIGAATGAVCGAFIDDIAGLFGKLARAFKRNKNARRTATNVNRLKRARTSANISTLRNALLNSTSHTKPSMASINPTIRGPNRIPPRFKNPDLSRTERGSLDIRLKDSEFLRSLEAARRPATRRDFWADYWAEYKNAFEAIEGSQ